MLKRVWIEKRELLSIQAAIGGPRGGAPAGKRAEQGMLNEACLICAGTAKKASTPPIVGGEAIGARQWTAHRAQKFCWSCSGTPPGADGLCSSDGAFDRTVWQIANASSARGAASAVVAAQKTLARSWA